MKLISMKCPQCNGELQVSENAKQAKCPFCNSAVMIDDEVRHVQFDNSEQFGYGFETGRMKAQQDFAERQEEQRRAALRAEQEAAKKKKRLVWWIIGWVLCFPIPLTILIAKTKKLKKGVKIGLIAALWVVLTALGALGAYLDNTKGTWADKVTPLSDFDYYINGDHMVLQEYRGNDQQIWVGSSYETDGKSYPVTALDGCFRLKNITSVIVPEGVTAISSNTFSCCGVKNVYLPSTLTEFNGWNYFHNGEKLYYGGTEEEWNALYTGERKDIDFKQIVFNAKVDDLVNENK